MNDTRYRFASIQRLARLYNAPLPPSSPVVFSTCSIGLRPVVSAEALVVCSRVTEVGVSKYTETYAGALTLDLVVVNGSLDTAEVLRQVSGKIRFVLLCDHPSRSPVGE